MCVLPWLAQMWGHLTVSEAGVPTAPTVHTGPDSEQRRVVPEAQALGSLVQVSLPLAPEQTLYVKLRSKSPFVLPALRSN